VKAVAVMLGLVLGACVSPGGFVCETDQQCGGDGVCESTGFCSFDDDQCPSGRRYGEHAASGLASQCVGAASGRVVEIRAGSDHSCAREEEGGIWCWGRNEYGALGDGTFVDRNAPTRVLGIDDAVALAAGELHTCAIDDEGVVWCWGRNDRGQLGEGTNIDHNDAHMVIGLPMAAVEIGLGEYHSCARLQDGAVWCWGRNDRGQLGDGNTADSSSPVKTLSGGLALAVDGQHSCARTTEGVRCWGENRLGQLGVDSGGDPRDVLSPIAVAWLDPMAAIAAGGEHTCGLMSDGTVWCAGSNEYGQLGDGTEGKRTGPVQVSGLDDAVALSAGEWFNCARTTAGKIRCWGRSSRGELGNGARRDGAAPGAAVALQKDALVVSAGERHACAQTDDGCVWCWGSDEFGQLGAGGSGHRATPVRAQLGCWGAVP
jgi:alpha-tubulin suppressor-like RCC1 family protein